MPVKPIPDGYHSVTPYLIVENAGKLIDFLKDAFDAREAERFTSPDGSVIHAEVKIGDSIIMMGQSGGDIKPMPCMIHLYMPDADAFYKKALKAGAVSVREPADQFYGDRTGGVRDFAGNQWYIATHIEDVSKEEMKKRADSYAEKRS